MRLIVRWVTSGLFALICAIALGDEVYHFVSEIPIGGEGGWDILTIDSTANRLYLSHATKVVVVDLGKTLSDRGNRRYAGSPCIRGCAGIAARIFIERQRIEIERCRSNNVENDFEN